ncbi:hypothetical protein WG461_02875, partial [Listeria monocytogenes]
AVTWPFIFYTIIWTLSLSQPNKLCQLFFFGTFIVKDNQYINFNLDSTKSDFSANIFILE